MMLQKYILLIFLPAVVEPLLCCTTITVKIQAGTDTRDAYVSFKGEDKELISDKERETFEITNEDLKKITKGVYGVACTDTFVRAPTPFGDVYSRYGWDKTVRRVEPTSWKLVSVNTTRILLASLNHSNHDSKPIKIEQNLVKVVKETVKHTWRANYQLELEKGVNYEVNFGPESVGGRLTLRYNSNFGEEDHQERKVAIGPASRSPVPVKPNSTIVENLYAVKGKMVFDVKYKATMEGDLFCNFENKYKGHHFYGLGVNYLLYRAKVPNVLYSYETVTITFYVRATQMLIDAKTGDTLSSQSGIIVKA